MFTIDVFTIFKDYIDIPCSLSLLGKAQKNNILQINSHDIRDWSTTPTSRIDDSPYGGGAGMLMSADPIVRAVEDVKPKGPVFLLSASGKKFTQQKAKELSQLPHGFGLICGRYEGVDQRVVDLVCEDEICIGDYVLFGGEVAALAVIESVCRLMPDVMGNKASFSDESFEDDLLEYPQYTRPEVYRDIKVPEVLLSGNHKEIEKWKIAKKEEKTQENRSDLSDFNKKNDRN